MTGRSIGAGEQNSRPVPANARCLSNSRQGRGSPIEHLGEDRPANEFPMPLDQENMILLLRGDDY